MIAFSRLALTLLLVACLSVATAQTYKCDWCVVGSGGGDMAGSDCKCSSTIGQTAAGPMVGSSYWALIGYWQTEGQTGVREQTFSPGQGPLITRLYSPFPTPTVLSATIRYSLAMDGPVTLRVHDLTGRVVRTLANGTMRPGRYSETWRGTDDHGRVLANGVYFVRMTAGSYRATEKMVLQR